MTWNAKPYDQKLYNKIVRREYISIIARLTSSFKRWLYCSYLRWYLRRSQLSRLVTIDRSSQILDTRSCKSQQGVSLNCRERTYSQLVANLVQFWNSENERLYQLVNWQVSDFNFTCNHSKISCLYLYDQREDDANQNHPKELTNTSKRANK